MSKKRKGTINLSIRNHNKTAIFCGRDFTLNSDESLKDLSDKELEDRAFDCLDIVLRHLDNVDKTVDGKATLEKEHTLIITILEDGEFLHEIENDISHYKNKNKYKINVKPLVPQFFKILKRGEVNYNVIEDFEELEVQDLSHID